MQQETTNTTRWSLLFEDQDSVVSDKINNPGNKSCTGSTLDLTSGEHKMESFSQEQNIIESVSMDRQSDTGTVKRKGP